MLSLFFFYFHGVNIFYLHIYYVIMFPLRYMEFVLNVRYQLINENNKVNKKHI